MVKRYNGGIKITLNDAFVVDRISSYTISENAETENFQKHDGSTFSTLKGYRYTFSLTTGWLTATEMESLRNVLSGYKVKVTDTDSNYGSGGAYFYITSISQPLEKADIYGKFYAVSIAASAVELTGGSGSL